MVLPNATLFPYALLPLHIFEPRYRAMLQWCLERHRMFCIALMKPGITEAETPADFFSVAGIGLVRACVGRPDGTSNLVLQGLARVRFIGFLQDQPFRVAEVREMSTPTADSVETQALTAKVLELCSALRGEGVQVPVALDEQLAKVSDSGVVGDVVAHTFIRDPHRRQDVLEKLPVIDRLRAVIRHLREEMGRSE